MKDLLIYLFLIANNTARYRRVFRRPCLQMYCGVQKKVRALRLKKEKKNWRVVSCESWEVRGREDVSETEQISRIHRMKALATAHGYYISAGFEIIILLVFGHLSDLSSGNPYFHRLSLAPDLFHFPLMLSL